MLAKVFTDLHSSEKSNSVSELVEIALAHCKDAVLLPEVYKLLPNIIFGKYESLVHSKPWTRHPATVVLKQICATLMVLTLHPVTLRRIALIYFQENGFPSFCESHVNARLKTFSDAYTWEVVPDNQAAPSTLIIRYIKLN